VASPVMPTPFAPTPGNGAVPTTVAASSSDAPQQGQRPDSAPRSPAGPEADREVATTTEHQQDAEWSVAEWHGRMLVDLDGGRIGKLQDVYVDVENDEPQFATVKEGFIGRHLTFVPLGGVKVGPDGLQVAVASEQIKSAPNMELHGEELSQADESSLYHHFELNYTPPNTESGRRLARR
jgi:hypothetical protein